MSNYELSISELRIIDKACDLFEQRLSNNTKRSSAYLSVLATLPIHLRYLASREMQLIELCKRQRACNGSNVRQRRVISDRYVRTELIGRGEWGNVYKGFDRQTGGPVAIKDPLNDGCRHSLFRESLILCSLDCMRCVPKIYEIGEEFSPYVVMEYIAGESLRTWCQGRGLAAILAMLANVCISVERLHVSGVVHRDLKPSNIKVSDSSHPVIVDFNASLFEFEEPGFLDCLGSPGYSGPRELLLSTVTANSDVYALGILTANLLTGIEAERLTQPSDAAKALSKKRVPLRLIDICESCMLGQSDRKCQTAGELATRFSAMALGMETSGEIPAGLRVELLKIIREDFVRLLSEREAYHDRAIPDLL